MRFLSIVACLLLISQVGAKCFGKLDVGGAGVSYVMANSNGGITVNGATLGLKHNSRAYLTSQCQDTFSPGVFKELYLLDKTLTFTTDLSSVTCGCNAAFYLVGMPGYGQNQQPDPSQGKDYYCDANKVGGNYCPEMDIMEANRAALQVTPHKCNSPQGKYYPYCDGGGCGQNTKYTNNAYGYGSNFQINTQRPFKVSMHFGTQGGSLAEITTVLSQDNKKVTLVHNSAKCGANYLQSMTEAFKKGLVLTVSYWGDSGMSWLDSPPCPSNAVCNTGGTPTFSGITIQ